MSYDSQTELYQQVILEHNKKPRNFRKLEGATHTAEGYNPLCGDDLTVYLHVDNNNIMACRNIGINNIRANKSSSTGDKDFHSCAPPQIKIHSCKK